MHFFLKESSENVPRYSWSLSPPSILFLTKEIRSKKMVTAYSAAVTTASVGSGDDRVTFLCMAILSTEFRYCSKMKRKAINS